VGSVIGFALYDELRLLGARIPEREELLSKLRLAVVTLDPHAARFLYQAVPLPLAGQGVRRRVSRVVSRARPVHVRVGGLVLLGPRFDGGTQSGPSPDSPIDRRVPRRPCEGLVRAQNNLFTTVLYTGMVA